jgi:predicted ATPase
MRIYFCGPSASGKTSVANELAKRLGLPQVPSAARQVLAALGCTPQQVRDRNDEASSTYQHAVFATQLANEKAADQGRGFISDRCIDVLVYASFQSRAAHSIYMTQEFADYGASLCSADALVFLFAPWREGVEAAQQTQERSMWLQWDELNRWYGGARVMLDCCAIPYVPVESENFEERLATVWNFTNQKWPWK